MKAATPITRKPKKSITKLACQLSVLTSKTKSWES